MSSLYAKLIDVIERQITPMAGAIGQQKYVTSIRDGFICCPALYDRRLVPVGVYLPAVSPDTTWGFARAWLQFSLDHRDALMLPFNFSMGVMTLFIAVGIAAQPRQTPSSGLADRRDAVADVVSAGSRAAERWPDLYCLLLRSGDLYRHSGGHLFHRAVRLPQTA